MSTSLSERDCAIMYMPEIPTIEVERDKLKDHNSSILKQIQEFKSKLLNSDKTSECAKCIDLLKSDFASINREREKEIKEKRKILKKKKKEIKEKEKDIKRKDDMIQTIKVIKLKESKITNLQSQLKTTEQRSLALQAESVELQQKFKAFEDKISALESKNADLKKNLQVDKDKAHLENVSTQKQFDISKKVIQEKKDLELRCIKLSKKVSEFEKILITERDTLSKERKNKSSEIEKKKSEKRNVGIFNEISEKTKNLDKDFEQERQIFESEISKLTSKISVLSSDIKDLEAANIDLSDKVSANVIVQSPVDNLTELVCSFKTASSSIHGKNVFKKKNVKPNNVKSNQIHPSNLFYDKSIDSPGSFYIKSLEKHSKKGQMVWRVKDSSNEQKKDKTSASTSNAKKNSKHTEMAQATLIASKNIKFIITESEVPKNNHLAWLDFHVVKYPHLVDAADFLKHLLTAYGLRKALRFPAKSKAGFDALPTDAELIQFLDDMEYFLGKQSSLHDPQQTTNKDSKGKHAFPTQLHLLPRNSVYKWEDRLPRSSEQDTAPDGLLGHSW
ncbi:hypothetical protein L6452_36998 [Arctium lappa]|uniref:Uncharacterized protein n=1 Tax=Arctium lappa TaxID=4217 RepID=A0ACB8Y1T3_ARCLA|nr:hypothetical protein L6452_36998 [Arctium lappa]